MLNTCLCIVKGMEGSIWGRGRKCSCTVSRTKEGRKVGGGGRKEGARSSVPGTALRPDSDLNN